MNIGFVGDIHGRVFHVLEAVLAWQQALGAPLDLVVQVGDLGAFPDPSAVDEPTSRFGREDPSELDFSRLLLAGDGLRDRLAAVRRELVRPVHFIRGDHEDFAWLDERLAGSGQVDVDPFGLFRHVASGTVLDVGGTTMAFLGGSEGGEGGAGIDADAYDALLRLEGGSVDVLVTHDAPWGVSTGFKGQTQGSRRITALVEALEPRFHFAGHLHHEIGPATFGPTTYLGLACLIRPPSRDPSRRICPGALALLDTESDEACFVAGPWIDSVSGSSESAL